MRLTRTLLLAAGCLLTAGAGTAFGELVYNGDFSFGNDGILSDYALVSPNSGAEQYAIVADPNNLMSVIPWNSTFTSFKDRTSGTGLMMVANGSTKEWSTPVVWAQQLSLTGGQEYTFSFWGANASPNSVSNSAALTLNFGSQSVALNLNNSPAGTWVNGSFNYTPVSNETGYLRILNTNYTLSGNDFAVDDISVRKIPEPSSLALLGIGALVGLGVYRRRRSK